MISLFARLGAHRLSSSLIVVASLASLRYISLIYISLVAASSLKCSAFACTRIAFACISIFASMIYNYTAREDSRIYYVLEQSIPQAHRDYRRRDFLSQEPNSLVKGFQGFSLFQP